MLEVGWGGGGPCCLHLCFWMGEVQGRDVVGIMVLVTGYLLDLSELFCAFIPSVSCSEAKCNSIVLSQRERVQLMLGQSKSNTISTNYLMIRMTSKLAL